MNFKIREISRLQTWMLLLSFFALWLAVSFNNAVEEGLAYLLIFSFGILHGANDLKLLQHSMGAGARLKGNQRLLLYYLGFVLVCGFLFYILPGIAIGAFILFSAYHFGEQHWVSKLPQTGRWVTIWFTVYGFLILSVLFQAHAREVSQVIRALTNFAGPSYLFTSALGLFIVIIVVLYGIKYKQIKGNIKLEVFYLIMFYMIFNTASLLWAFAIYFIFWHSVPSLADQIRFLYGSLSLANFYTYVKSSAVYWIASLTGLAILYMVFRDFVPTFLPFFFSFLAAITFPHVFVIKALYTDLEPNAKA